MLIIMITKDALKNNCMIRVTLYNYLLSKITLKYKVH